MRLISLLAGLCVWLAVPVAPALGKSSTGCGTLGSSVQCGATANPGGGDFHGLVAVGGAPWVIGLAAHSGTQAGCGDCTWSLVVACKSNAPGGASSRGCSGRKAGCKPHEFSFHVYLTTDAETDVFEGTVCIGGEDQPIPIGDDARNDVERYLRNVTPPDLDITTSPREATLAGLSTSFSARPPSSLRPTPFGGAVVSETITLAPTRQSWQWGDGDGTGWVPTSDTMTHTYIHGGTAAGSLASRWGATYTITYDGLTFGPYAATGELTKRQHFALPVRTSTPVLISH